MQVRSGFPPGRIGGYSGVMSQENIEAFKRALEAGNRRDFDALLEELDPEVEWHPAMQALLGGEATVYRGPEGAREALRDLFDSFAELHLEISEVRDLGDRVLAHGRMRGRGTESGVEIESPWAYLLEFRNGKAIWVRAFLDPGEALGAEELPRRRLPVAVAGQLPNRLAHLHSPWAIRPDDPCEQGVTAVANLHRLAVQAAEREHNLHQCRHS
jgi:ketosteroid isomerase-like protein